MGPDRPGLEPPMFLGEAIQCEMRATSLYIRGTPVSSLDFVMVGDDNNTCSAQCLVTEGKNA